MILSGCIFINPPSHTKRNLDFGQVQIDLYQEFKVIHQSNLDDHEEQDLERNT